MANLTARQESFIKLMTESRELAWRGFQLLLKRDDLETFFDPLKDAGLFDPARNPAPIAVESGGFRVPYWEALDYLVAVAELSGKRSDLALAQKVMDVVRTVSRWREPDGRARDNYHTSRKFAEILGLVLTAAVSLADLDFVPEWLSVRFEQGTVVHALDKGALHRFLTSESAQDWEKAVVVLRHCTEPVANAYWLNELIHHHSEAFGARAGNEASRIFLERVREIFNRGMHKTHSYLCRPAIENHEQNRPFYSPENWSVKGLRDVVLSWCEHDPAGARQFVPILLGDEAEIVRRLGIYVLDQRWDILQSLYPDFVGAQLFNSGHLHELYNLLRHRFGEMTDEEKASTVDAIRKLPRPAWGDNPDRSLKRPFVSWRVGDHPGVGG